jgi:WD40 repeat protein
MAAYGRWPKTVAFAPDGRTLASAGLDENEDGPIKFWDPASGTLLRSLPYPKDGDHIQKLLYSHDGKALYSSDLSGTNESFKLRDPYTGRPLRSFRHGFDLDGFAVSPDGHLFATTGGLNNTTKIWDATTGQLLFDVPRKFGSNLSVTFSQDSKKAIVIT